MAVTLGPVNHLTITVVFQDFRGQKKTLKLQVDAATTDTQIGLIVGSLDNLSNAKILSAEVSAVRLAAGLKTAAVNTGHEVNVSELMEYTLTAVNPLNSAKKIARTIGIPAMIGAQENVDGSPIAVTGVGGDTSAAPTAGTALDMYNLLHTLEAQMNILMATGSRDTPGFTYQNSQSHHISIGDVVDGH
jgi:hypothetical protein